MIDTTPSAVLGFGFLLGIRHALDVDHLAAVSTIVAGRRSLWSSWLIGALWGLGHTASLLAVALAVVALHAEIPPLVAVGLELVVAVMLIGLGADVLWTFVRGKRMERGRANAASHRRVRRPFVVGLVHGLAGSAGLMLAVAATIPSPALALTYVGVFGAGSIGGMATMTALLGAPLALLGRRFARAEGAVGACAAVASVLVGALLAWHLGAQAGALL